MILNSTIIIDRKIMKTKLSLILIGVLLIVGCTKSATELLDRSQKSLDENQVELAAGNGYLLMMK